MQKNNKWEHYKHYSVLEIGRDDNSGFHIEVDYDDYNLYSWSIYSNFGIRLEHKSGYKTKEMAMKSGEYEMGKIIQPLAEWLKRLDDHNITDWTKY